jgi:transcriptional regulator with XRE-family HTH domain
VLDDKDKNNDLNWKSFIEKNEDKEDFAEIIEVIKELEKEKNKEKRISLTKKAIYKIKERNFSKNKEEYDVIWKKLKEESEGFNEKDLNWWDKFFIDRGTDMKIRKILRKLSVADETGQEKDVLIAIKAINKLDKDYYEYDLSKLNRRIRILEKRLDRRISDSFGSILSSIREQKGLSLSELEKLAGVSASYINRIELNQRKAPSYPIIEKLADALEVNINTLLVAAGANIKKASVKSLRELIFSNNISLMDNQNPLSLEKKEKLIKIIDFISKMDWKENKHIESLELFNLITEYKEEQ